MLMIGHKVSTCCFFVAEALLAGQGLDPADFLFTEKDYRLFNRLAGNACTSSVLGGCVIALLFGVLIKDAENQQLDLHLVWSCLKSFYRFLLCQILGSCTYIFLTSLSWA
jgi:hypothetical protein